MALAQECVIFATRRAGAPMSWRTAPRFPGRRYTRSRVGRRASRVRVRCDASRWRLKFPWKICWDSRTRSSRPCITRSGRRRVVREVFLTGHPPRAGRCRFPMARESAGLDRDDRRIAIRGRPGDSGQEQRSRGDLFARGRVDVQAARLASLSDRRRRRGRILEELHGMLPAGPFFVLIDGFDTRSRFIG